MANFNRISFNEGLFTGNDLIDEQHRKIILQYNLLVNALNDGSVESQELLDKLIIHVREHFKDEEKYIKSINYPEFEKHRKKHYLIVLELEIINIKSERGWTDELKQSLIEKFRNLIIFHILIEDRKFIAFQKSKEV